MRATQLEDCKQFYNAANEEKSATEALLEEKTEGKTAVEAEMRKWKKKFEFLVALDNKKQSLADLKAELTWTLVKNAESEISSEQEFQEGVKGKLDSVAKKLEEQENFQHNYKTQKQTIEDKIQALAEECDEIGKDAESRQSEYQSMKGERRKLERILAETDRKVKVNRSELKAIDAAIESVRATDEGQVRQRIEARNQKITQTEEGKKEKEAKLASTRSHMDNLDYSIGIYSEKAKEMQAKYRRIGAEIRQKSNEINNYKRQSDSKLVVFGDKMPRFVDEIQKNVNKFKRKPIGPLGAHLQLKPDVSEVQAKLIEFELRSYIRAFLVDNFDDKRVLDQIAARCGVNVTIITSKFGGQVHDISRGKCDSPNFPTIFDSLIVQDPNVTNCLIDHRHVEQILMIPNDHDAQRLLKSASTVPQNCLYALTNSLNQYYPAPSYRSYAMTVKKGKPTLQASVEELVEMLEQEVQTMQEEAKEIKVEMESNFKQVQTNEEEKSNGEKVCRQLRSEMARLGQSLNELRAEAEADKSPDISALEEDREKAAENLENIEQKREKIVMDIERNREEEKEKLKLVTEKRDELQEHAAKSTPLQEEIDRLERDFAAIKGKKDRLTSKRVDYQKRLRASEAQITKCEEKRVQYLKKAQKFAENPPFEEGAKLRDPKMIHKELQIGEEAIKRQEESQEPAEVIKTNYREFSMQLARLNGHIDELTKVVSCLDRQLRFRRSGYLSMRGSIARSANHHFSHRLTTRNYHGKLAFDHKEHLLKILVNPNAKNDDPSEIRDIKTLSGGEKSYCTVSLVLALWDDMHPPFRILDEFDVFMDSINRRTAIDLIISYAKQSRRFQYMFLTPLNLDHLKDEKDDVQVVCFEKNQG